MANGIKSTRIYDATGASALVTLTQGPLDPQAFAQFSIGLPQWYYAVRVEAGLVHLEQVLGNVTTELATASYAASTWRSLEIAHDAVTDEVVFASRADDGTRTEHVREPWAPGIVLRDTRIELKAGARAPCTATTAVAFNDFRIAVPPAAALPVTDPLDDGTIDPGWTVTGLFTDSANRAIPVVETGDPQWHDGALGVGPFPATDPGAGVNGLGSAQVYDFTGRTASVRVTQGPSDPLTFAQLSVGVADWYYTVRVESGLVIFEEVVAGVTSTLKSIPYVPDETRRLWIRHEADGSTSQVVFLTQGGNNPTPGGPVILGDPVEQVRVPWAGGIPVTALRFELRGGVRGVCQDCAAVRFNDCNRQP